MANDGLAKNVFNYIRVRGGVVELSFLLTSPSPLARFNSERKTRDWLQPREECFSLERGDNMEIIDSQSVP